MQVDTSSNNQFQLPDFALMSLVGLFFGIIGGLAQSIVGTIIGVLLLLAFYSMYQQVSYNPKGLTVGMLTGIGIGVGLGYINLQIGGSIESIESGALFGLIKGLLVGALIGAITRAEGEPDDSAGTKAFLFVGSVFVGMVLGGLAGGASGLIMGLVGVNELDWIGFAWFGKLTSAAILGLIVGGYMGAFFKNRRAVAIGASTGAILGSCGVLIGGGVEGIVLGLLSGSVTPMLLVASIGAFGGTARGLKAMFVEALEAPMEMLDQGAVAFLAPAMTVGLIVGTSTAGAAGIAALALSLGIIGMVFGALEELRGGVNATRLSMRSMIEIAMLGTETWPIGHFIERITRANKEDVLRAAGRGILFGLIGSVLGSLIGYQVLIALQSLL